jgi:endonuclease/exonuclease/phosphatase (EEP) superfamily protein YafD
MYRKSIGSSGECFVRPLCALVLLVLPIGCGERPLEPREPTPGVAHFTIATFNVEDGKESDASTVNAIGATHADLICLQETGEGWVRVIKERYAAEYPYMLFEPGGTGGLAVLSKKRLISREVYPGVAGGHPTWSLYAETEAGWMSLLNVHLRSLYAAKKGLIKDYLSWGSDHVTQLESAVTRVGSAEPTISLPRMVLGDFNDGENGDAVAYLATLGLTDALPLFHPGQFTWRHPSLANQFDEALDHVLFDEWVEPLNAYVVNQGRSDHIPVVAHFEVSHTWPDFDPSPLLADRDAAKSPIVAGVPIRQP